MNRLKIIFLISLVIGFMTLNYASLANAQAIKPPKSFSSIKEKQTITPKKFRHDVTIDKKPISSTLSKQEQTILDIISEKALIPKPETAALEEQTKENRDVSDLQSANIDAAAKTLLSILPKDSTKVPFFFDKEDGSIVTRILTVAPNNSFIGIFNEIGYSRDDINMFMHLLDQEGFDTTKLRAGQRFILKERIVDNKPQFISLHVPYGLSILKIQNTEEGFKFFKDNKEVKSHYVFVEGNIQSTILNLTARKSVPQKVSANAVKILSGKYDLSSQLRRGDKFELLYEQIYDDNNKLIDSGRVVYVAVKGQIIDTQIYKYKKGDATEDYDYYEKDGSGLKKTITRNPLKKRYRISSGFGYRKHPVLNRKIMHAGTDFAAPRGTPVYAAGDGVIEKIGRYGGYGNYIKIRHDSTWQTSYGHLKGFAKGMSKWKRVKLGDLIGYVGNTGRSTGPHLHYEILKYGKAVNSQTVSLPVSRKLSTKEMQNFLKQQQEIDLTIKNMAKN